MEFAGLAHDLGHPPFGHIGERALDDYLKKCGGFEGNAQTLRILARIEKKKKAKDTDEVGFKGVIDKRYGLNLTYRSFASILKYDRPIPKQRNTEDKLAKGYYESEAELVAQIKEHVTGKKGFDDPFKTIECAIMDIADDIAYSTFDLEDTFKANFLSPMNFLAVIEPVLKKVHEKVTANDDLKDLKENDILKILHHCISPYLNREYFTELEDANLNKNEGLIYATGLFYRTSCKLNNDGYTRYQFTSVMIDEFIEWLKY